MLKRGTVSLGYRCLRSQVTLTLTAAKDDASRLRSQLADAFPDATITQLDDAIDTTGNKACAYVAKVWLQPEIFSLKCHSDFEDRMARTLTDPVAQILSVMQGGGSDSVDIDITLRHANAQRCRKAEQLAMSLQSYKSMRYRRLARWYAHLRTDRRLHRRIAGWTVTPALKAFHRSDDPSSRDETTLAKVRSPFLLEATVTVVTQAASRKVAKDRIAQVAASFSNFDTDACQFELGRVRRIPTRGVRVPRRGFLLTPQEVASLWHPPTSGVAVAGMAVSPFRHTEPPSNLPAIRKEEGIATLGRVLFRNRNDMFGIRSDDRFRHIAILGKTGMGKSTLLESLIAADIKAGQGVALLDPHGDLAEQILTWVPRVRTNDICYFDAGDQAFPIAFNPLACRNVPERPLVASGIVSAFKKIYGDSWGPRLEYILRNALLALVDTPDSSLASVLRLLSDARFRGQVVSRLTDPVVRGFWEQEFSNWRPQMQAEAIAPIQNKVGQFIAHPILREILGRPDSRIDIRQFMDESKVLIVNLSKGRIGEDASTLLGSLLVSQLQLAAMSQSDLPPEERTDFFAYVDEFQNFATESFATILSEARKYRLSLTVANQYLAQLDDATLHALFGNVGTLLTFQVGAKDAELLAEQLGGNIEPSDLMSLPKFTAYARLLIDGLPSRPFSMQTIVPRRSQDSGRIDVIRKTSRHRYGKRSV
ncbi:MAG: type IV secretion system DNA-binding domain-containing protein [Planctomycetaceae bacterium]|nr:type IV secretion system DNA-binding domain-containing protein [Planctomycetales bacterium]MCB9924554.1 type IV secretion system DNA-binding domain-containing protein [Planctomycetaceae bacterium]